MLWVAKGLPILTGLPIFATYKPHQLASNRKRKEVQVFHNTHTTNQKISCVLIDCKGNYFLSDFGILLFISASTSLQRHL